VRIQPVPWKSLRHWTDNSGVPVTQTVISSKSAIDLFIWRLTQIGNFVTDSLCGGKSAQEVEDSEQQTIHTF